VSVLLENTSQKPIRNSIKREFEKYIQQNYLLNDFSNGLSFAAVGTLQHIDTRRFESDFKESN
jgi:hypothetical protein